MIEMNEMIQFAGDLGGADISAAFYDSHGEAIPVKITTERVPRNPERRLEYRITYPAQTTGDLTGETESMTTFIKYKADSLTRYLKARRIPFRVEDRVWTASEWV